MIVMEVIGPSPIRAECSELLDNEKQAAQLAYLEARVDKKWTPSPEMRERCGLLLSPPMVLDGIVIAQGKVDTNDRIVGLLQG